jgi:hypothetical protein
MAAHAGLLRRCENLYRGVRPRHGCTENEGWATDIDGCIGEVVVAKALGVYWSPGQLGANDLDALGIEIRSSRHDRPHLILHATDHDDRPYVLVWLHQNRGYVAGWLLGAEGKREDFWRTDVRAPAFFVPIEKLHPFVELKVKLKQEKKS